MKIRTAFPVLLVTLALALGAAPAATAAALPPPIINNPGDAFPPGPSLSTSAVIFTWTQITGATGYGLYIVDLNDSVIVYPNSSGITTTPLTNSPFILPSGFLAGGKSYAWAMTTFNGNVESTLSIYRYFQMPVSSLQPPPILGATATTISSFNANWSFVPGANGYVIDVSSSSTFNSFIPNGQNVDVGSNNTAVITSLDSSTTYYYRVRAYNAIATSGNSSTAATTTLPYSLPIPTATAATFVTTNSFRANWNSSIIATGYRVDISTNINFSNFIPGGQDFDAGLSLSAFIGNLIPNTKYYYRVRAYDTTGTSSKSATIGVTTLPNVLSPPAATAATTITTTSFTANWGGVTGATSYLLDVAIDNGFLNYVGGYQNLNVGNVTSKSVTGLSTNMTYYYRVRAFGPLGTSSNSVTIAVTTLPPPPSSAPTANAATSITSSGFSASWSAVSDATAYSLDVSTNSSFSNFITGYNNLNVGNVISRTVNGLRSTTTYYYRVRATNAGGASANSGTIAVTTLTAPPSPPVPVVASSITNNGFRANWKSSATATGYQLDVSLSSAFTSFVSGYQNLDVGNVTNQSVVGLTGSTVYYYRVRAYGPGGTSGNSGVVKVTTLVNPPAAPDVNAATSVTASTFTANWTKVTGATAYHLDISTNSLFSNFLTGYQNLNVSNVAAKAVSGLRAGTTYYYRLRASNAGGASTNSATITVTTIPPAPVATAATALASTSFTANWNAANGATGYRLDVATNSTFTSFVSGWQNRDVGNTLSTNVTGLIPNKTYYYRAHAYNGSGTSATSGTINLKTGPLPPPTILTTTHGSNLVLSWPTNDPAFKLFYATNVPSATWISNPAAPAIVSGQYTVTNSMTNSERFYRLKK